MRRPLNVHSAYVASACGDGIDYGLDQAPFDYAREQVPGPGICALHNPGQFGCRHLAFAKEPSEYLEFLAGSH